MLTSYFQKKIIEVCINLQCIEKYVFKILNFTVETERL